MLRLAAIFSAIILVFDVLWALLAKAVSINWGTSLILSAVLYVAMGVYAGVRLGIWQRATIAIAIAALVDWTLGWFIAWSIGPGFVFNSPSPVELLAGVIFGTLYGTAFGAVGAFFGCRAAKMGSPQ